MHLTFFQKTSQRSFISSLLANNTANLNKIYTHPFNQQLFDGTLSAALFGRYLRDDCFYLHHFSSVLNKLALRTRGVNPKLASHLIYLATQIIHGEQEMQLQYSEYLALDDTCPTPGKAISSYVDFLITHAEHAELPVALSSLFPCFGIYSHLGAIQRNPDQLMFNPYKEWIATYSSPTFIAATKQLASTINKSGLHSDSKLKAEMNNAFSKAVQFELEFFDDAYYFWALSKTIKIPQ